MAKKIKKVKNREDLEEYTNYSESSSNISHPSPLSPANLNVNNASQSQFSESEGEEKFYLALGHEIRRQILRYIGQNTQAGFSDLKKMLHVSTGTIYHHLEILQDLITQNAQKKYLLTAFGIHAYRFLMQNGDSIESIKSEKEIFDDTDNSNLKTIGLLKPIFKFMIQDYSHSLLIAISIIILTGFFSALFQVQAFVNIFLPLDQSVENSFLGNPWWHFFSVIIGYLILFGLVEALSRLLFKKARNSKWLLSLMSISYLPLLVYVLFLGLLRLFSMEPAMFLFISRFLLILFQIWCTFLLSYSISFIKLIKLERGLIIVIFIDYFTLMILLLVNSPFF